MTKNIQKIKQYLFDENLYFESNIETNLTQIVFNKFDTEITVWFKFDSSLMRMLINGESCLKAHYSNEIEEIIEQIDIYCKQQECQQQQIVEIFT
jgi:hypothetical protein